MFAWARRNVEAKTALAFGPSVFQPIGLHGLAFSTGHLGGEIVLLPGSA